MNYIIRFIFILLMCTYNTQGQERPNAGGSSNLNAITNLQPSVLFGQSGTNGSIGIWDSFSPGYDQIIPDGTGKLTSGAGWSGVFSGAFTGNGAGLTNLNASQLTSGTLADARLGPNVLTNNDQRAQVNLATNGGLTVSNLTVNGTLVLPGTLKPSSVAYNSLKMVDGLGSSAGLQIGAEGNSTSVSFVVSRDISGLEFVNMAGSTLLGWDTASHLAIDGLPTSGYLYKYSSGNVGVNGGLNVSGTITANGFISSSTYGNTNLPLVVTSTNGAIAGIDTNANFFGLPYRSTNMVVATLTTTTTVTFSKPFPPWVGTNYSISLVPDGTWAAAANAAWSLKTTNGFNLLTSSVAGGGRVDVTAWIAQ